MSWRTEKTKIGSDYVWDGVEFGIASSPTQGIANIQNANISTQTGEVMASFARTAQTPASITNGTLTPDGATNFTGPATLKAGQWIRVSASTVTSITAATSPSSVTADYLVVAGGGGGGVARDTVQGGSGGGGAGAVRTGTNSFSVGTTSITVGRGGSGGTTQGAMDGTNGEDSVLGSVVTSTGGGGGGGAYLTLQSNGKNGGSGGGGGSNGTGSTTGGTGTTGGNNGGDSGVASTAGGGGGGAGAVGTASSGGSGGNGGNGTASSISGTSVTYGGGGAGGGTAGAGNAGTGGGGTGGSGDGNGGNGTDGLGGGGGGAADTTNSIQTGGTGGSGVVIISYTTGAMVATGGTITHVGGKTIHTFLEDGVFTVLSIPTGGLYYVSYASGTTFKLSAKFDPTGANALTHGTTGSITFSTIAVPNQAIAKATEKYTTSTTTEYRYYVVDANSYLWVFDSYIYDTYGTQWMLPDPSDYSTLKLTGIAALNGMLLAVGIGAIYGKPTVDLGSYFIQLNNSFLNEPFATHRNMAIAGGQGKMYYCDGNYIGEIFPTTSLITSIANIQSQCSYTASTTTGTLTSVIGGSMPYDPAGTLIPAVFFTDVYGTLPTDLVENTIYYIQINPADKTFQVFDAASNGVLKNLATGAAGNQYFTTFWPFGPIAGINGSSPTVQFSPQRVNLPQNETAQCLVEIGNTVLIGGKTNTVYPWNQIDATPSDFITLPESDVKTMINVNNMAYIFAGNKGNIYISNGSVASLALKVPDYCAGIAGTPYSYIDPYFVWGDATYCRGRVYFSILDQTSTKTGNCGGNWSFVPVQNMDPNQQIGMALRLENQNSYGDYDGYSTILISNEEQDAIAPRYWAFWQDSYNTGSAAFGVDYSTANPVTQYIIETDILPTGTQLTQETFQQLEYKLTTALASGDSVQMYYRLNATDAWTSCGNVIEESTNKIAGYFEQNFQKTQWVQFRIVVTTGGTTSSSFVRLRQVMLR